MMILHLCNDSEVVNDNRIFLEGSIFWFDLIGPWGACLSVPPPGHRVGSWSRGPATQLC